LLIYAAIKRAPRAAAIALIWGLAYLGLGLFQHHRAMAEAKQWVAAHAENPTRLTARPTFSNLWVWRIVFLDGNEWRTVALYKPFWPGAVTRIYNGDRVEAQPELFFLGYEPEHQPAIDIMRFNHFSDGYLGFYRRDDGLYYGDVRYGTYPNSATPLWGIRIPENCPDCHVEFVRFERQMEWSKYWAFLKGATLPEGVEGGRLTRVP
jgi:inner membrane protein